MYKYIDDSLKQWLDILNTTATTESRTEDVTDKVYGTPTKDDSIELKLKDGKYVMEGKDGERKERKVLSCDGESDRVR